MYKEKLAKKVYYVYTVHIYKDACMAPKTKPA